MRIVDALRLLLFELFQLTFNQLSHSISCRIAAQPGINEGLFQHHQFIPCLVIEPNDDLSEPIVVTCIRTDGGTDGRAGASI
jgi:hypothetical protein